VAVYLAVRLVIVLTPTGYRLVKLEQSASGQPSWEAVANWMWDRWRGDESDEALTAATSEYAGRLAEVTTYNEPFELRKVQFIWSITDAATAMEDARVATFHLLKAPGGTPTSDWLAADFTALDTAFGTWWTTLKTRFASHLSYDRLKVYKAGPGIVPPQPPVYDADKTVPGTGGTNTTPPQVAISVTEIAGSKRYWGRFYLPNPAQVEIGSFGRIAVATQTAIADATDTLYTSLRSATLEPVVYRAPLPERETKAGATLPARPGSAWTVEKVQVDDVFDVIRRRRFKYPTLRVQRDI
jgi:hypothetical protein